MADMWAPKSYWQASSAELDRATNGCGPESWKWDLSPWMMRIARFNPNGACKIHDWMYSEGYTLAHKDEADRVFLNNMLRVVDNLGGWGWLRAWRRRLAFAFYQAVAEFGGPAFWDGEKRSTLRAAD